MRTDKEISIVDGVVDIEREDEEDDATGPTTSSANLKLHVPALPKALTGPMDRIWPESIGLDAPFKLACGLACLLAWWSSPWSFYAYVVWGLAWVLWLGSLSRCCLPWLPNSD